MDNSLRKQYSADVLDALRQFKTGQLDECCALNVVLDVVESAFSEGYSNGYDTAEGHGEGWT